MSLFSKKPKPLPPAIKTVEEAGEFRIIRFQGSLDIASVSLLEEHVRKIKAEKSFQYKNVLLDFAEVDYIDSSAIAMVVRCVSDYKKSHHRMGILNLRSEPLNMLEITRVDQLIRVYPTYEEAARDLSAPPA